MILFAGPTLGRAEALAGPLPVGGVTVLPPIQRGDLPRLVARRREPGAVAIVDGLFHQALAVGHAEIRAALAAGWTVYGLSSMGAIRAREMQAMGMVGFGRVYERYLREDIDVRDDEVALLHEPAPPWREISEPLIHLRAWLEDAAARGALDPAIAAALVEELDGMWYGERTLAFVASRLRARGIDAAPLVADLDRHRLKALDLVEFLRARPWTK